ncbi:hypothetical protein phiPLPE_56 [Iodobacter phage PhiPLPE]|uniref:Dit-like phage tail protein N-terminal domain-containing protein n=1 Tax=Iodobacter phage PhiPLPE TaxID=551895 RepID=B5AX75_9CAUD|nr:tail fiber protein [Iodobacter phage PhiPLPE]ACG60378.1 hypothetical protein phiPLPE_56 [Iodobacter phage PhiPLPE]
MSIVNIFTKSAPTLAGMEFDAVLEDTLDVTATITDYTIEIGARVGDHRIINPIKWTLTGAVSNTPIGPTATDFIGGVISELGGGGVLSTLAGLSSGYLAGSDQTRASSTIDILMQIMSQGEPFDIDAGDVQLTNMVITRMTRTKDASNEGGLIFTCELQELPTLSTVLSKQQPKQDQLRDGDPAKTGVAALINKGEVAVKEAGQKVNAAVSEVLGGLF